MYDPKLQGFVFYRSRATHTLISLVSFLTGFVFVLPMSLLFWATGIYFGAIPLGACFIVFGVLFPAIIHIRNQENLPALIVNEKGIDILNVGCFEWKDIEKIAVDSAEYCCLVFNFKEEIMPLEVRDEFSFGRVRHRPVKDAFFQTTTHKEFKECIELISKFHPVQQRKSHKSEGRLMVASNVKIGCFKVRGKRKS